jgi:hypothetical protein
MTDILESKDLGLDVIVREPTVLCVNCSPELTQELKDSAPLDDSTSRPGTYAEGDSTQNQPESC